MAVVSLILGWLGFAVIVAVSLGYASSLARRLPSAHGDAELATELQRLCSRRTRRLAASVVDLGDRPSGRSAFVRADAATRFEIGSVTKALTGLLLADAVDRGEVALETRVGDVVDEARNSRLAGVTLRELCTHTSGLPRLPMNAKSAARRLLYGYLGIDPYRGVSATSLLSVAARQRLRGRGRSRYSNLGGAVLGQVLARAAARDFDALLTERVLGPLGMGGAGVSRTDARARWGWSAVGLPRMPWLMDGYAPAGGVYATLSDLTALAEALLDGTAPGLAALSPVVDQGEYRQIGMFWVVDTVPDTDRQMVWHNGATRGYSAFLSIFPQARRAVVVLADVSRPKDTERIAMALARWLISRPSEA